MQDILPGRDPSMVGDVPPDHLHVLFDSPHYCVVHTLIAPPMNARARRRLRRAGWSDREVVEPRHGFELFNKQTRKTIFLTDALSEKFAAQITRWQQRMPELEDVERVIERYISINPTILQVQ